ncbi:hypothetical protein BJY59DRAFT_689546 [Rhodotorula toruloides]
MADEADTLISKRRPPGLSCLLVATAGLRSKQATVCPPRTIQHMHSARRPGLPGNRCPVSTACLLLREKSDVVWKMGRAGRETARASWRGRRGTGCCAPALLSGSGVGVCESCTAAGRVHEAQECEDEGKEPPCEHSVARCDPCDDLSDVE